MRRSRATCCSTASGARVPGRDAHGRRPRRAAAAQARPTGADPHAPRRGLQGGHAVRTLPRARLFAATLAALALTLALTVAIGAVLTRRHGRPNQASDARAPRRRPRAREEAQHRQLRRRRTTRLGQSARDRRAARRARRVRAGRRTRSSNGRLTSRRALPLLLPAAAARGLAAPPAGERCAPRMATVPPRPAARRRSSGAGLAAAISFLARPVDRAADPARRRREPRARGRASRPTPLPDEGTTELASLAAGVQRDGGAARRLARDRAELPALGQPRAEDAADRDPRVRRGARARARSRPRRPRPRSSSSRAGSSGSSATCSTSRG